MSGNDSAEQEDLFDLLGEDIIPREILSRLDIRSAVSTCILSTSWRRRWTGIPSFDFTDADLFSNTRDLGGEDVVEEFHNTMDRLLQPSVSLESFVLDITHIGSRVIPGRIRDFIGRVIDRQVQRLEIVVDSELHCFDVEMFPITLRRCGHVKYLRS